MLEEQECKLILDLLHTRSPKERVIILQSYLIEHPETDSEIKGRLLAHLRDDRTAQSELGKVNYQKRYKAPKKAPGKAPTHPPSKNGSGYAKGKFFADFKGGPCDGCQQAIKPGPAWRHRLDGGEYRSYHVPCVPDVEKTDMQCDRAYIEWSNPKSGAVGRATEEHVGDEDSWDEE